MNPLSRFVSEFFDVLAKADMRLSCVMLGLGLMMWGIIGVAYVPHEVTRAASRFALGDNAFLWAMNYFGVGAGYIWVGVRNLPHPQSMLLGCYSAMIWTMIAVARPTDTFTSGVTLNLIVVIMGLMLVQRSGRR